MPWNHTSSMDQKIQFIADCMRDLQPFSQLFRSGDRRSSNQHGASFLPHFQDFLDCRRVFCFERGEDPRNLAAAANALAMRGNHNHFQPVTAAQFATSRPCGSGGSRKICVLAKVVDKARW